MTARRTFGLLAGLGLLLVLPVAAQDVQMDPDTVNFRLSMEGEQFTAAVKIFLLLTMLSVAPAMVLMMTSFTRIVIVFSFLKQAMGSRQAPSNKTVSALALFLTIFIMQPVWTEIYDQAVVPYADEELSEDEAIERGIKPLKGFMLRQTRESTLLLFMELSDMEPVEAVEDLPMRVVVPAFMLSELKTAFQMAFLIYLPFLLIDAVVATTLMSMGMFMLPPMMVSMPFKLLLFVMFNGWELLVRTLVTSFY
mgnify:FL=1